jgi:hypothetical protein
MLDMKVEALQMILKQSLDEGVNESNNIDQNIVSYRTDLRCTMEELIRMYPDDWMYWKQYCDACIIDCNYNIEDGCNLVEEFRKSMLHHHDETDCATTNDTSNDSRSTTYPTRGPQLVHVELASRRLADNIIQQPHPNDAYIMSLIECTIQYGNEWSSRASCIYSDLSTYIEQCIKICAMDHVQTLLQWSKTMRMANKPTSENRKVRHQQLRAYIFATQINFHVLRNLDALQNDELIAWEELVGVWYSFQTIENTENVEQVCKIIQSCNLKIAQLGIISLTMTYIYTLICFPKKRHNWKVVLRMN